MSDNAASDFKDRDGSRLMAQNAIDSARDFLVWLMFASSFFVLREPAPCDVLIIILLGFFLLPGLSLEVAFIPLILLLIFYNFGSFTSYLINNGDADARYFVLSAVYMSLSAVFFASYMSRDSQRRFDLIKQSYVFGATIAALIGLAVYFDVYGFANVMYKFADAELYQTMRATGAHKDPNVYSTYLVLPCLMLLQGFLNGSNKRPFISFICFTLIFMALFLAFSRGAWINAVMSSVLVALFTYILTPHAAMRRRIVLYVIGGIVLLAIILAILLSVPSIQSLFLDRFTLAKSYDTAETGRFGNQLNSIPVLLTLPFGFGPYVFAHIYGLAPHNTFLNAFSAGGWLGGISFIVLTACNVSVGLRTIFKPSPYQNMAIVVFSCLVSVIFQGIQIDMEHWRHYYWMMGMLWGLAAASTAYSAQKA